MRLNDYSSRFLTVLVQEFPLLERQFTLTKEPGCFEVCIPTTDARQLHISTQEFGRIRVASDCHDVHFGGWIHSNPDEAFADAMSYIRSWANRP